MPFDEANNIAESFNGGRAALPVSFDLTNTHRLCIVYNLMSFHYHSKDISMRIIPLFNQYNLPLLYQYIRSDTNPICFSKKILFFYKIFLTIKTI